MSKQDSAIATKLTRIRESYIKQLPTQLEVILASYKAFVLSNQGRTLLEDLHRQIHTMRGACASFRLSMLSSVAMAAEQLAKEALLESVTVDREWHQKMQGHFNRLASEISLADPSQGMELQIQELAMANEVTRDRERKLVYLCEDDAYQRLTLATQIGCFGFEVLSFADPGHLVNAVKNAPPDVIIMDMILPGRPQGGAETMKEIQTERKNPIPTIFISSQGSITNRLSAVSVGSSAFMVKPVNMTELCSTISILTSADMPEPYRILIVDDDPRLAEYHSLILQEAGMVTLVVNEPLQVMTPLCEFKPDLILMDMYMPGCNGADLAKVIRQISAYFSIPIVYLSGETDLDKQFQAMQVGGDAFLTKPIESHRLVSAVVARAERMKVIRSFMVRDSMTGLLNHTATKEHLDMAIAQSQRKQEDVCFAMIDVDKFKMVNDTYGHPIGDRVLVALARLIRQRVRKTDTVGRYGGEEFAVVLPGCNISEAVNLMNEIRESFSALSFQAKDETFFCTFSCGVASLSLHGDAASLNTGADAALYVAKNSGRNRVVTATGVNR